MGVGVVMGADAQFETLLPTCFAEETVSAKRLRLAEWKIVTWYRTLVLTQYKILTPDSDLPYTYVQRKASYKIRVLRKGKG